MLSPVNKEMRQLLSRVCVPGTFRSLLHLHTAPMAQTGTQTISYEDLKALVGKSSDLFLVDVRTKEEVDKGRIPGSVHIPVDTVGAALAMTPEDFKAKYGVNKPAADAQEVVFHCQMGRRGATATDRAAELGYRNARNYAGGYKEWSEKEGK